MKQTFILFVFFLSFLSFSQSREIGLDVGYWNWREYETHFSRIGIKYFYSPKKAFFKLKTGLTFDNVRETKSHLNFIRIPIGIDVTFGKKMQPIIGFSLLNSFWLNPNAANDNVVNKYIFQFVANPCVGVAYQINTKYNLGLTYQYNFDIVPLYFYEASGISGHHYTEGKYNSYGFFNLCFRYKLREGK
jgi:hypothetical protein